MYETNRPVFSRVREIEKSDSFVMYVCPPVRIERGSVWTDFQEI